MFTRLLFLWVTGAFLLPLNWGIEFDSEEYEDTTPTPDYDFNATFDYYLYNASVNYDMFAVLQENTQENQGNKGSVSVYSPCGIITGLLVLQICQQT